MSRNIQDGIDTINDRLVEGYPPILKAIDQSKREVLLAFREGMATPDVVMKETYRSLANQDLNFAQWVQVMGARTAAAWALGDQEDI